MLEGLSASAYPDNWSIIDKCFFGKPVRIEGELNKELEKRFCEIVEWYKRMGYAVEIL
jgi:hypothetical protein